jgi:cell wall-associated NlpC family hydrolase
VRAPAYQSVQMQQRLYAVAMSWLGTPFRGHADIKGAGVDCVNLAVSIYAESGFTFVYNPPSYTLDGGRHIPLSKVTTWIEASGKFDRVEGPAAIGDVLCLRIGKVEHHVGIKISEASFIQAVRHYGVILSNVADPTWAKRLTRIYRPMEGQFEPA